MDVGLPRETQQIDRVMEAFANRYLGSNRSLFISDGMSFLRRERYSDPYRYQIIHISSPSALSCSTLTRSINPTNGK
jgi:hypothetical protein